MRLLPIRTGEWQIRVLWFYDEGKMIVCSHGFVKKSRKVPRHDIAQAQDHRRHYFDAKRRNQLTIGGSAR